jgi:CheY-like chemotaxis protein
VIRRILIAEPNDDVRSLLEVLVRKLGYLPVTEGQEADAVVLEPSCERGRALLKRLGENAPPVVCLSIYPRESGFEPPESVAYLVKPASQAQLGAALRHALAA